MGRNDRDRGAAAVEFALVLPLLVALTFGIITFGNAYHTLTVLDNAARDAVRIYTLTNAGDPVLAAAEAAIESAGATVVITRDDVEVTPQPCTPGADARVTITKSVVVFGGILEDATTITLTGSGAMRCNG